MKIAFSVPNLTLSQLPHESLPPFRTYALSWGLAFKVKGLEFGGGLLACWLSAGNEGTDEKIETYHIAVKYAATPTRSSIPY